MAVLLQLTIEPATQDHHDALDARVGQHFMQAGGPPTGLMSHVVYPEGGGFTIATVWRTEGEGRVFVDDVLQPIVTEMGLTVSGPTARPVWGFARP
jgi:predicted glycoside hydrolase/deacetylase ChbG (UPF0249 family)